jgi:hypothetical protein
VRHATLLWGLLTLFDNDTHHALDMFNKAQIAAIALAITHILQAQGNLQQTQSVDDKAREQQINHELSKIDDA